MGNVLIVAAIGDETVAGVVEVELLDEALYGGHQLNENISITGFEGHHAADLTLGYDEDVQGVARLGVMKS